MTEVGEEAALDYAEKSSWILVRWIEFFVGLFTKSEPIVGALHGLLEIGFAAVGGGAFVEGHDDVGAEVVLDFDRFLGSEVVGGAVDVGFEGDAVVVDFDAVFGAAEGENLEAARVGEDWAIPIDPFVQAAHFFDKFVAGAEVEVVGVGEDDFGVDGFEVFLA